MIDMFEKVSKHSWAYAEICNIIELADFHRENCHTSNCNVSLYLAKRTLDRLLSHVRNWEKQDAILKVTSFNWK